MIEAVKNWEIYSNNREELQETLVCNATSGVDGGSWSAPVGNESMIFGQSSNTPGIQSSNIPGIYYSPNSSGAGVVDFNFRNMIASSPEVEILLVNLAGERGKAGYKLAQFLFREGRSDFLNCLLTASEFLKLESPEVCEIVARLIEDGYSDDFASLLKSAQKLAK